MVQMTWFATTGTTRETSSFLASIFRHVTDAILVVGREGYVIGANPAAEKMFGWSADELIGKIPLCELCQGMATCTEEATCADCFAKKANVPSFEMRVRARNGREFPVTASSTMLPDMSEGAFVVILRDMTEQYRVERERMQLMMTNYVIQAQEEERKRISRDLHDGVGQALYSILVGLRVLNQYEFNDELKEHLLDIQHLTARALEEVKSMAVELRPSALDDLGLVPAIRSYIKRYEQTFGIESKLEATGTRRRYSSAVETALYRICQEAMINAAKYADTDQLFVRFSDLGDVIELSIIDHGRGFDPEQVRSQGTGLGLYGMRERASLLGGEVMIQSSPGEGTTITVRIPINDKGGPLHVDPGAYRR